MIGNDPELRQAALARLNLPKKIELLQESLDFLAKMDALLQNPMGKRGGYRDYRREREDNSKKLYEVFPSVNDVIKFLTRLDRTGMIYIDPETISFGDTVRLYSLKGERWGPFFLKSTYCEDGHCVFRNSTTKETGDKTLAEVLILSDPNGRPRFVYDVEGSLLRALQKNADARKLMLEARDDTARLINAIGSIESAIESTEDQKALQEVFLKFSKPELVEKYSYNFYAHLLGKIQDKTFLKTAAENLALPFIVRLAALEQLKGDPLIGQIDKKLRMALTGSPAAQKFIGGSYKEVGENGNAGERQIEFLRKMYGVKVEAAYTDSLQLLQSLRKNLSLYPPGYVRAVLDIVFLRNVGSGRGGYASGRMFALSDISAFSGGSHHELEHVNDNFYDGTDENNTSWVQLNPQGYAAYYKGDFKDCREKAPYRQRPRGFPSSYGHCNADEDQAEVAELLMSDPTKAQEWAQTDAVLAGKIEQVKIYMRRRSGGLMDDQYWRDLEAGKVNEAYWSERAKAQQGQR